MHRNGTFRIPAHAAKLFAFLFAVVVFALAFNALYAQTPAEPPPQAPDGTLIRVYFGDEAQLAMLSAAYDIWEVNRQDGYALIYATRQASDALEAAGFVVAEDSVKTAEFLASLPVFPAGQVDPASARAIPGYACYRTVEETYAALAGLAAARPDLAGWVDIGDSWEKTQPGGAAGYNLHVLILTNQNRPGPKPRFFLAASTHGRELTTAELATRFAERLVSQYGVDPEVTWLLDYNELHLVAQANPDGRKKAEAGYSWRKNTNSSYGCANSSQWGVDLNRNHSFKWGVAGISTDPCNNIYPGPSARSEPEAQAIEDYGRSLFAVRRGPADSDPAPADTEGVMITLHSYGSMVLYSWGWTSSPAPNAAQLATLGRKFGYYNGYTVGQGSTTLYPTSGDMDDWFYGTLGVPGFTFELGTAFFQSCSYFETNIIDKNIQALIYAFKAARRPYQAPAGPEVTEAAVAPAAVTPGQPALLTAQVSDNRYGGAGEPSQAVVAARYSIDLPSWAGGATYPLQATDGAFDEVSELVQVAIPTGALPLGRHIVFVEGQDADGMWGVPTAVFVTVIEAPEGCTNLLTNGAFETTGSWVFAGTPVPGAYVDNPVYIGARALRLGILATSANVYAYSTAYQRVTLPAAGRITLRYWERTGGQADGVDYRETLLLKDSAGLLARLTRSNSAGSEQWQLRSFDMTSYRGQRVIVYFNVFNDGRNSRQWNHLDQVELLTCPEELPPTPTPTPTPSLTPTPGPTPTPAPDVCQELLANGTFEAATNWQFGATPSRAGYVANPVHGGSQAVRMGLPPDIANRLTYSSVYQRVAIPAGSGQVRLTYWERPGGGDGVDFREVLLLNTDYSRLRTIERMTAAGSGDTWRQRVFDLSAFAGRTVVLYFNVYNDGRSTQMWNHLDDVSLALCTQPAEAAAMAPETDAEAMLPVAADIAVASPAFVFLDDTPERRTATVELANRNPEGSELTWQAEADVPWLQVDAVAGQAPGTLSVSLAGDEFDVGIHQGRILLTHTALAGETVEVPVVLMWGMHERLYMPLLVGE